MFSSRSALTAAIAGLVLVAAVTIRRVPTPSPDAELYASIARSVQEYGIGVPSVVLKSPVAVDHLPFYGPVFFNLAATSFHLFGVALVSLRLVSLFGALLLAASGALLAYELTGHVDRALWSALLLLLAPDVFNEATSGTMATLAVGLCLLALAAFVRAQRANSGRSWVSVAAGAALTLAALTTPRAYPFVAGFFIAGCLCLRRRSLILAALTCVSGIVLWSIVAQGDPIRWVRYVTFVLSHEDRDVAILPGAVREWAFHWTALVVPAFACAGAAIAWRSSARDEPGESAAARFAIVAGLIAFAITFVTANLTFSLGPYLAVPLFAAVAALPVAQLRVGARRLRAAVCVLVLCEAGTYAIKYARVAATWSARDLDLADDFFRRHVPPGSMVVGAEAPFFFPVERAHAAYRSISPASWADWARWIPAIEPDAVTADDALVIPTPTARFLVWNAADDLPPGYACAQGHLDALFVPPPRHLRILGPLARTNDAGYAPTALYRLPRGCPTGYDPTASDLSVEHERRDGGAEELEQHDRRQDEKRPIARDRVLDN